MFSSLIFVLMIFHADGSVTSIPGWRTFQSCESAQQVVLNESQNLYAEAVPKRPIAAVCVAQSGTGAES